MSILDELKTGRLIMDGAMGTMLQAAGLQPGELPELWNLSHPQAVVDIHKAYFDAGSHLVVTNTFGANSFHYSDDILESVVRAAVANARKAAELSCGKQNKYVALDIGPLGHLLKPFGDLAFEDAVAVFSRTIRIGAACDVDLIYIETINDCYEMKAAVLAAKENCSLPVFASNAYGEDGRLLTGASPASMVCMLEGLGVDALGANCSLGPDKMMPVAEELLACASVPVLIKPNAGMPVMENGKTVFHVQPEDFACTVRKIAAMGASILGGCCGTDPDYIRALSDAVSGLPPVMIQKKHFSAITSYGKTVTFGETPVIIGERINPTGKKRFQQALRDHDIDYVLREGLSQEDDGAMVLDVNCGLPGLKEAELLPELVFSLQSVTALPLQLDTTDSRALEAALRLYNGKALINSVNGKEESMHAVFPLAKKYGAVVVALTLDETGIPSDAEGRIAVAEKILKTAAGYGISSEDLIFDPLALAVSADNGAALQTLKAVAMLHAKGLHTILGVSNVSFGLPLRDAVNSQFFSLALDRGLDAAIMNPHAQEMMKTYRTSLLIHGKDPSCASYISAAAFWNQTPAVQAAKGEPESLHSAIVKGLKENAAKLCAGLLENTEAMDIVNGEIIPALDTVGRAFESKTVFLPQLLMSADAAGAAFEVIRTEMAKHGTVGKCKGKFVLATVKGDIHDIGKNIVKALLENYGYQVIDLGRDVAPQVIADAVAAEKAPLCGLSALMTTTVPAMEETIRLLRSQAPWCKVVTGGAVLTEEYVRSIGADCFGRDAMETVRYAERICVQV